MHHTHHMHNMSICIICNIWTICTNWNIWNVCIICTQCNILNICTTWMWMMQYVCPIHLYVLIGCVLHKEIICHNPSLKLVTKARACEDVGQEWSLGITFHAPGSVGECEGMKLHTPKWAPTLGVGVLMDSQIFREWLQGLKPIRLKSSLYH
jgi:hypothetical protein